MAPPLGEFVAEPRLTTTESENWRGLIEATVPTLGVLNPSVSEIVDPNSTAGQALNYQAMFGVNAAGRVERNARLFGTAPELGGFLAFKDPLDPDPWENSVDPVSDEPTTVGDVSDGVALTKADDSSRIVKKTTWHLVSWEDFKKIAGVGFVGIATSLVGGYLALLWFHPIATVIGSLLLILICVGDHISRHNSAYKEYQQYITLPSQQRSFALPGESGAYRGADNSSPMPIETLFHMVSKPVLGETSDLMLNELRNNIDRLGYELKNFSVSKRQFQDGLSVLMDIFIEPPIFREKGQPKLDSEIRDRALMALALAVSNEKLPQGFTFTFSLLLKAVQVLRKYCSSARPVGIESARKFMEFLSGGRVSYSYDDDENNKLLNLVLRTYTAIESRAQGNDDEP